MRQQTAFGCSDGIIIIAKAFYFVPKDGAELSREVKKTC